MNRLMKCYDVDRLVKKKAKKLSESLGRLCKLIILMSFLKEKLNLKPDPEHIKRTKEMEDMNKCKCNYLINGFTNNYCQCGKSSFDLRGRGESKLESRLWKHYKKKNEIDIITKTFTLIER